MIAALVLGAAGAVSPEAAVTCAALWAGFADEARVSAYLDGDAVALAQAEDFKDIAVAAGLDPAAVSQGVAAQREGMFLMVRAATRGSDPTSRDLFERQMQRCDALKAEAAG